MASDHDADLFLADLPVVRRRVAGLQLVERPSPERRPEVVAEAARLVVEEVQKPGSAFAGSGLCARPSRGSPSL
jgi:hypothetical protein